MTPPLDMEEKSVNLEKVYKPNRKRKEFQTNLFKLRAIDFTQTLLLIRTGKPSCFALVILKQCEGQRDRGWVLIGITSEFCSSQKIECNHLVKLRTLVKKL